MKKESNNVENILAHTKWNCKYHIVFAPKYHRKMRHSKATRILSVKLRLSTILSHSEVLLDCFFYFAGRLVIRHQRVKANCIFKVARFTID